MSSSTRVTPIGYSPHKVVRTTNGGQNITYTDFQDGHEYTMELSPDWPRPWTIYEVEILSSNVFVKSGKRQPSRKQILGDNTDLSGKRVNQDLNVNPRRVVR